VSWGTGSIAYTQGMCVPVCTCDPMLRRKKHELQSYVVAAPGQCTEYGSTYVRTWVRSSPHSLSSMYLQAGQSIAAWGWRRTAGRLGGSNCLTPTTHGIYLQRTPRPRKTEIGKAMGHTFKAIKHGPKSSAPTRLHTCVVKGPNFALGNSRVGRKGVWDQQTC
jgi:hypothetical protein